MLATCPCRPTSSGRTRREDEERYQTVYSREMGSAACPTAGLHFTEGILAALDEKGDRAGRRHPPRGPGHLPSRSDGERRGPRDARGGVLGPRAYRARGDGRKGRRKACARGGHDEPAYAGVGLVPGEGLRPGRGSTKIFIFPGYRFKAVDMLFTNFHTPKSTLLMLVSAFAGRESILDAYAEAVRERYRFFSYGDAMLIR